MHTNVHVQDRKVVVSTCSSVEPPLKRVNWAPPNPDTFDPEFIVWVMSIASKERNKGDD